MTSLKDQLKQDLTQSLKDQDSVRSSTIRMARSEEHTSELQSH